MNTFESSAIVVALFVLRIGLPLAMTLLFGMLMNRLLTQEYIGE